MEELLFYYMEGRFLMKEKKSFLIYFDWEAPIDCLDDKSLGKLFRGIFKYAKNNTEPDFSDPMLYVIFSFVKAAIDRDNLSYEQRCKQNSENAKKGAEKKKQSDTNIPPHDFNSLLKTLN